MSPVTFLFIWAGSALLLSCIPSIQRTSLTDRLRPYVPSADSKTKRLRVARSLREVALPLATLIGDRLTRALGVNEELAVRLERCHESKTVAAFRTHQFALAFWSALTLSGLLAVLRVPPALIGLLVWVAPILSFLIPEQLLIQRSTARREQVRRELPIVAEQIAMLLDAGLSRSGALQRVSTHSDGAIAQDLNRVLMRIGQGLSESQALAEWGRIANVESLDRILAVLQFDQASDLGRLISDEAKVCRHDAHRRLLESIERKAQAVWIPVTVAALVPGVIFLSIPFIRALSIFAE